MKSPIQTNLQRITLAIFTLFLGIFSQFIWAENNQIKPSQSMENRKMESTTQNRLAKNSISNPIKYKEDGIIITVMSQGCTRKNDFFIGFNQKSQLMIKRLKVDRCRAKPRPIQLYFTFKELGIEPIYL